MSSVINIYKGSSSLSKLGFVADTTTFNVLCSCTENLCNQVDTLSSLVADIQDCNTNLNTCLINLSTEYTTCTSCLQTQVTANTADITDLKSNKADCSYTHVLGNCVDNLNTCTSCLRTDLNTVNTNTTTNTIDITDLKSNKADCADVITDVTFTKDNLIVNKNGTCNCLNINCFENLCTTLLTSPSEEQALAIKTDQSLELSGQNVNLISTSGNLNLTTVCCSTLKKVEDNVVVFDGNCVQLCCPTYVKGNSVIRVVSWDSSTCVLCLCGD